MIRRIVLIVTMLSFGYMIAVQKPILAALVFAAGYIAYAYVKRKGEEIVEDERSHVMGEKASKFALATFIFSFGVFIVAAEFLKVVRISDETIRLLSVLVGVLLLLYVTGYVYYSWRLS